MTLKSQVTVARETYEPRDFFRDGLHALWVKVRHERNLYSPHWVSYVPHHWWPPKQKRLQREFYAQVNARVAAKRFDRDAKGTPPF